MYPAIDVDNLIIFKRQIFKRVEMPVTWDVTPCNLVHEY